jgi:hypothetical protein
MCGVSMQNPAFAMEDHSKTEVKQAAGTSKTPTAVSVVNYPKATSVYNTFKEPRTYHASNFVKVIESFRGEFKKAFLAKNSDSLKSVFSEVDAFTADSVFTKVSALRESLNINPEASGINQFADIYEVSRMAWSEAKLNEVYGERNGIVHPNNLLAKSDLPGDLQSENHYSMAFILPQQAKINNLATLDYFLDSPLPRAIHLNQSYNFDDISVRLKEGHTKVGGDGSNSQLGVGNILKLFDDQIKNAEKNASGVIQDANLLALQDKLNKIDKDTLLNAFNDHDRLRVADLVFTSEDTAKLVLHGILDKSILTEGLHNESGTDYTLYSISLLNWNNIKDNAPIIDGYNYMADVLHMPSDKFGFNKLLVIVDIGSDAFDIK